MSEQGLHRRDDTVVVDLDVSGDAAAPDAVVVTHNVLADGMDDDDAPKLDNATAMRIFQRYGACAT